MVVNAENIDVAPYSVVITGGYTLVDSNNDVTIDSFVLYYNDGKQQYKEDKHVDIDSGLIDINLSWKFGGLNGNNLFKGGKQTTVTIDNAYYSVLLNESGVSRYLRSPSFRGLVEYYDYSYEYITFEGSTGGRSHLVSTFTPSKDVRSITVQFFDSTTVKYGINELTFYLGEHYGDGTFVLKAEQQSEESGLLSGILGSLGDGFNALKNGISNLANGISEVVSGIKNLPTTLWNLISDGLKSLFVPTEEQITTFKTNLDTLLSNKLGAIYEVVTILFEGWEDIGNYDDTNTINVPLVTIPLPDNESFSFGGYDVQIVPSGFEFLVDFVKMIVGIGCTVLFVNGLKRRYDEVMGD